MVNVSVKIDQKSFEEFQKACEAFAKGLGVDTHDVAIRQAHLICMDAMNFTPPMLKSGGGGLEKGAQNAGDGAVKADINSIAVSANKRSAAFMMYRKLGDAAFRNDRSYFDRILQNSNKALKTVRNSIMIKIANDPDHERAFKKSRNLFARAIPQTSTDNLSQTFLSDIKDQHMRLKTKYDGRNIRKKQRRMDWLNKYVTTDQSVIDKEINRSKLQVGALKAGWYKAKQQIPSMKGKAVKNPGGIIPAWVSRHGAPNGITKYKYNEKTLSLSLVNLIGNNNNVATTAGTKNIVYGNRVKQMPAELQKVLEAQAVKFNKKSKTKNGN
jgi:hypothetical protein